MKKTLNIITLFFLYLVSFFPSNSIAQKSYFDLANEYAQSGNYNEAIRLMKQVISQDYEKESFIEEIATVAYLYSYLQEKDSTCLYNNRVVDIAEKMALRNDSIAEIYIQSTFWNYLRIGLYEQALAVGMRTYELREKHWGETSKECWEWLKILEYKALDNNDLENLCGFVQKRHEISRKPNLDSSRLEDILWDIRGYAHHLICHIPTFTLNWINPYYKIIVFSFT